MVKKLRLLPNSLHLYMHMSTHAVENDTAFWIRDFYSVMQVLDRETNRLKSQEISVPMDGTQGLA